MRLTRYLAICLLVLLASAKVAWAQNDAQYVIKTKDSEHYLAHVKVGNDWVLQDATEFSPNCLWYSGIEHNISGTTHNYYFIDENGVYHYLSAPLQAESPLGLSNSMPPTYLLSNTDQVYYFYDWDSDNGSDGGGVARGHQYSLAEGPCKSVGHEWSDYAGECWDVFWVAYNNSGWTTSVNSYDIDDLPHATYVGGRYHIVTATDYKTHVSGGIGNLSDMEMTFNSSQALTATVTLPYRFKKYTHYHFVENTGTKESPNLVEYNYYYYDDNIHNAEPTDANITKSSVMNYEWSLTGDGAQYLSFASESELHTIQGASPTLYYRVNNLTGNKVAVLKLKITYENGETQETTANVIVKTECQNPPQYAAPVVSYEDVLITWHHIAESYRVYWKKASAPSFVQNEDVPTNFHIFSDLESNTVYEYKVYAICNGSEVHDPEPTVYSFTTLEEHDLLVYGSVFGGGRMADVSGNTEVVVINANSIGSIYGGNDIAGTVHGDDGSTITIGVNTGDAYASEGTTQDPITIGSVYGGGNGYYSYGSTTFAPIAHDAPSTATIAAGQGIYAFNPEDNVWNISEWTNGSLAESTISIPSITKTAITVNNDYITIDTIFGGAKNAFVTNAVPNADGTSVTISGGTIRSVFGGNNVGGKQTAGKHHIVVDEGDKSPSGRYLTRIHTLFGGGNMVQGSTTDIHVNGGMIDTLYAGGNAASVAAANVTVDCALASGSGTTFGKTYSSAIESTDGSTITVKDDYTWDCSVDYDYNIRALFGGNNKADMNVVPSITLTSGSIGILYGGGNAGDMNAEDDTHNGDISADFGPVYTSFEPQTTSPINISTHVELSSPKVLIDYLYGGCQMSDVYRSTWVVMSNGHVGTVYGGCNISGDVGSRYLESSQWNAGPRSARYQAVKGATYVNVSGGHIYKDLFAGGNGRYHCNDGRNYIAGIDFDDLEGRYIGMPVPTHNETHVIVSGSAEINGNVYAGGNLACVGFINETTPLRFFSGGYTTSPTFVGLATVQMSGGTVHGNVFGGGNMASIWGSNAVAVSGGTIQGALYGGNDRIGLVAQITNRVLPPSYTIASDGHTSLAEVRTYISLTGRPEVNTVYGGGNGNYDYEHGMYCNSNDQPVQSNTFVDVNIDGYIDGSHPAGHIGTVYGGGDGVTVTGTTTVFLNVKGDNEGNVANVDHVGTIFGGNNKGPLEILPDIVLLKGHVNTVYGGCNQGAMVGSHSRTIAGTTYDNLSSMVRLRDSYTADGNTVIPSAVVTGAVYGGCRMNGVTNNTLVLVEHGTHPANFFGGSDISGTVGGTSHVVVTGDGQTGNVYGGGNGNYDYVNDNENSSYKVYVAGSNHAVDGNLVVSGSSAFTAPECATSVVDLLGGQVGASGNGRDVYGGGWGPQTSTTGNVEVNIGLVDAASAAATPTVYGNIYGGSALGSVNSSNSSNSNTTTVNFLNGTLHGNLFGGGLGEAGDADKGKTYGKVFVNISNSSQTADNCFIDLRDASIYGCNNTNGSPQDDVTVHVWKTAFNYSDYPSGDNYTAASGTHPNYAIANVFGGGNLAGYQPAGGNKTLVYVHGCLNTIGRLFGGGNAAASLHASTIVEGGRFDQIFGGGNGVSSPANIGAGGIELAVSGGKIRQLFGGNNTSGEISGPMSINVTNSGNCDEDITEFFGGSNAAPMGTVTPVDLTTTIGCNAANPVSITNVYGGSNLATITGNVTLTIKGGTFTDVYAGSKGVAGTAADITGNTTLNLYGGTITNAFGGNNVNGNITGSIAVNVLDYEACPLNVTNIYGASNATEYAPTDPASQSHSPVINLMHVKEGSTVTNLFGGGNQGEVTANPVVNIGYVAETMAGLVPDDYPGTSTFHTAPRAYVSGNVYGGGNEAGVGSPTVNMTSGTVANDVYGGCNSNGTVTGDIAVNLMGGTVGQDLFGGGKGNATRTDGNVTVTIDGGSVTRDVYGGSALGQVNTNTDNLTKVWLKSGTVRDLYGGGKGQADQANWGKVNGNVDVLVDGGSARHVFGCNNANEQPLGTVNVTIDEKGTAPTTVSGNVYGGGNNAYYDGTPQVHIQGGTVTGNVFGGGNAIATANKGVAASNVEMTGGTVIGGLYGGCNSDGDVLGNSVVNIYGGTIGATNSRASIHGGGYGAATTVAGNVTVTFGEASSVHTDNLILYGDLYGGSALGTVNTNSSNSTTVNIMNGIITGVGEGFENYGNIFGGGLGNNDHPAAVYGVVTVNVGSTTMGKASLAHCNVYGCNNTKGTPQGDVFVNIYETAHILQDEANYYEPDNSYAIYQVFGGGNEADYAPDNGNADASNRTTVHIYGCDNTVMYVYGGSNAAAAVGVITIIEGGRFSQVYGGGNGSVRDADIGKGGIGLNVVAGNVGYIVEGSNRNGNNAGGTYKPDASSNCLGGLFVDSYFFGANEAELYGDLTNYISCEEAGNFEYKRVYAGSRWGTVYGDINLMVSGGTIENLFGGCQGEDRYSADVRRFPANPTEASDSRYSDGVRAFLASHPEYYGRGGNINLVITGGTIGNVFGGCDYKGNVDGRISVTVSEGDNASCPLFIGNVYGASNFWYYSPEVATSTTPDVRIIKGVIGGTNSNLPVNNIYGVPATEYEGNVFGGGNQGNVTANPRVIIGDGDLEHPSLVTVNGSVYGGGNKGNVTGNPDVVVVPKRHTLVFGETVNGSITVKNSHNQTVASSSQIGEGVDLSITALPVNYGYKLDTWSCTGEGSEIAEKKLSSTTFTMGKADATISASFTEIATKNSLTITTPTGGTATVTGILGTVSSGTTIGEGIVLTLTATPDNTHRFTSWNVTGGTVASPTSTTTTFTMGSSAATITANFSEATSHSVTLTTPSNGSFAVSGAGGTVSSGSNVGEGAVLTLAATPASGYVFSEWIIGGAGSSVANASDPTTTFTMGSADATIEASFVQSHKLTISPAAHGDIRVLNTLGETVESGGRVGENATLSIKATPATGYAFQSWSVEGSGATIGNVNIPITSLTMGTADATISATFAVAHTLTIVQPQQGSIKATSSLMNHTIISPASVGEGAVLNIEATPIAGRSFVRWEVSGGATVADANDASTTLTMGSGDATITAVFE